MDQFDRYDRERRDARDGKPRPRPRARKKTDSTAGAKASRATSASTRKGSSTGRTTKTPGTGTRSATSARGASPGRKPPTGARPSQPRPTSTQNRAGKRPKGRAPLTRRGKIVRWIFRGAGLLALVGLIVGSLGYVAIARSLPDISGTARGTDQTSVIYDRNGEVLAKLFADQNRTDKPLKDIPVALQHAVVATEDQRFYEHKGVDPWGIARALWVDVLQGKHHGGSTITQQYVVNAFVERENTLTRKAKEALLAYRLEKKHSKDEILQLYLNTIYFGHGAYGVESAAQVYFGKSVSDLDLAESATIAGIIKSPGRYSPYLDPEAAVNRRNTVLGQMLEQGYISQTEHDEAEAQEFKLTGLADTSAIAPYFVEYVKTKLIDEFGSEVVYRGGISVHTTLDLRMQRAAEKAVKETLDKEGDPSAALVALDPKTGEILAMVGGRDFAKQQFNVAVQGLRQPGSSFKPFVLATALEEGVLPEQTFKSAAGSFKLPNGQTWNVSGAHSGPAMMRLRQATEKSVNSVFAQLILDIGPDDVVATAEKMGIHEDIAPVPAIALGGLKDGVSPLEMASAYGTFAAGGTHTDAYGISEVSDNKGTQLYAAEPTTTAALDPAVAYLTTDILKGVIKRGTGTAAAIGRPAAGKTGTTQEYRDAWFVGYTPEISCAVWVGYAEGQIEMTNVHGRTVTGGSFPAEIWQKFMAEAVSGTDETDFPKPDGLVTVKTCDETGLTATEWCPDTTSRLFLAGHVPETCTTHTGPKKIDIPSLIGMTKEDALALLKKLMLLFKVVEKDVKGVPAGIVAAQDPAAGSSGTTETVVTITVSNGGGTNAPPTALFKATPETVAAGQPVTFDASASTDDGSIALYFWEFGDDSGEADGITITHTFVAPGSYDVTLWVTDDKDQTSSITKTIVVQ